jgi:hypothetical protein
MSRRFLKHTHRCVWEGVFQRWLTFGAATKGEGTAMNVNLEWGSRWNKMGRRRKPARVCRRHSSWWSVYCCCHCLWTSEASFFNLSTQIYTVTLQGTSKLSTWDWDCITGPPYSAIPDSWTEQLWGSLQHLSRQPLLDSPPSRCVSQSNNTPLFGNHCGLSPVLPSWVAFLNHVYRQTVVFPFSFLFLKIWLFTGKFWKFGMLWKQA